MSDLNAALQRTADILATPETWTQGAIARLADGTDTASFDPKAVCFCLLGARRLAAGGNRAMEDRLASAIALSAQTLFPTRCEAAGAPRTVEYFNDDPLTTHDDVLQVLRHAQTV